MSIFPKKVLFILADITFRITANYLTMSYESQISGTLTVKLKQLTDEKELEVLIEPLIHHLKQGGLFSINRNSSSF